MPIASPLLAPAHAAIEALPVYSGEAHTYIDCGHYNAALALIIAKQEANGGHNAEAWEYAIDMVSRLRLDVRHREACEEGAPTPRNTGDAAAS